MTHQPHYSVTNRAFANNALFVRACKIAGVQPTKRQASKWRNNTGRAYSKRHAALVELKQETSNA